MDVLPIVVVFLVLGLTFLGFVREWLPADLVAMAAFAVCIVCGFVGPGEVADVFRNGAPLTIGAMFVLSAALARTGVIEGLAHLFQRLAGRSEKRAMAILAVIVIPLSACINNTPVVVVFLPVVIGFVRSMDLKASRLLIPLSFFAILGGTMTLFGTSTNILVSAVVEEHGLAGFGVFEITPLGAIYAVVGSIYLFVVGRRLLPDRHTISSLFASDDTRTFLSSAVLHAGSPLVGRTMSESALWNERTARVFDVVRGGVRVVDTPIDRIRLEAGDMIVFKASPRVVAAIAESGELTFDPTAPDARGTRVKLAEVMVAPQSRFVGRTLRQLEIRQRHGVVVAALHRKGANLFDKLETHRLHVGDTLLIEAPEGNLERFKTGEEGLIFLNDEVERPYRRRKAPLAIAAILAVVGLAAAGVPILSAALVGAVAVLVLGCVDPREAYQSIEWPILFIIFGMLGLGKAMENTGAALLLAESAAGFLAPLGPLAVLAVIYLLASFLTEVVTNNAVAILLTPIAISIAEGMGVDPRPFVVGVMFGASASFATPIGYQTNTYVFGAGGYRFSDFVRVGLPLNLLLWATAVLCIPLLWPF